MARYHKQDDGSTVDGSVLVWLGDAHGPAGESVSQETLAEATAAALRTAATAGTPFCAECEAARRALLAR
jgi:hypothetical protein